MTEEIKIPVRMLYLGQRESTKAKLLDSWYHLDFPDMETVENDGSPLKEIEGRGIAYDKVRPLGCMPGTIFTFDKSEDLKSIFQGSYRDVDRWKNNEDNCKWEIKHRAAYQIVKQKSLAKKVGRKASFQDSIESLQKIYHRLSFQEQSTFLVMLVTEIRKTRKYQSERD